MSKYDRKFIDAIATCDGDIYFNCQSYTIIAEESNCQSCNSTSIIVNHLENNNIPSYNALLAVIMQNSSLKNYPLMLLHLEFC